LFFDNINGGELDDICKYKNERSYKKGEIIVDEGEEIKEFMYLKEGLVKIYKKRDDRHSQIISIAKPMDFVSLLSVFSDVQYQYSMSALEDSVICSINLPVIKLLVKKNGKFAINMLDKISRASDDIVKIRFDISHKNLRGRIAYILLYFSDKIYKSKIFDLPLSRKEIAEIIDMTTENVIRILSEFRKDGLISINGKTIEIKNHPLLLRFSEVA
jgi:CRP/FNR family transcriptional regulator